MDLRAIKSYKNLSESDKNNSTLLPGNGEISLNMNFKAIFGELLEEQKERIRKSSPFGNFKTWDISKIIGK